MQVVEQDIELLLEGCLANNRRAQEALYRQFYTFAMTIALRYSRDEHDAAFYMVKPFIHHNLLYPGMQRTFGGIKGSNAFKNFYERMAQDISRIMFIP